MWDNTKLEALAYNKLDEETEILSTDTLWNGYTALKQYLCDNVLPNIARTEPDLTDHSEKHIQDVQRNIYKIIESRLDEFNTMEIFFLAHASLIHDIGNIFGRDGHTHTAKEIIKKLPFSNTDIKRISNSIAKAHGGSGDTIGKLDATIPYNNMAISCREIASIIRFADECAEGEQRCYAFGLDYGLITDTVSIPHHIYSKVTSFHIDKNQINLHYHLYLEDFKTNHEFEDFLKFIFGRIIKTNKERIYCSQYSKTVSQYNALNITIGLAEEELEDPFEKIVFTINNLTMLECTTDPAESENRIGKVMSLEKITHYYESEETYEPE